MRELVNIIGFRINEAQLASVEARVSNLAKMMSFALTIPVTMFGKSILEAGDKYAKLKLTVDTFADSQEQANKVVEDLTKLALKLPTLSMEDLNEQAGKLIGQGVPLSELVDTLQMLSVVAGATGGNFQNLAKAYMDVQRAGKLQGQEVLQFKNANVPIYDLLSKSTGRSIAQLKKERATFEEVKKALQLFGGEGSKAFEVMIKKGQLLSGVWLKLKDMFTLFKIQIYPKLVYPLFKVLDVLDKIVTTLSGLDGNWKRFFVIGMAVMAIVPPLILLKTVLASYLKPLAIILGIMGALALIIDEIYVTLKGGDSVLNAMFGKEGEAESRLEKLKQAFSNFLESMKPWWTSFANTFKSIISQAFDPKEWKEFFNLLSGFVADFFTGLLNGLSGVSTFIYQLLNLDFSGMYQSMQSLATNFNASLKQIGSGASNLPSYLMQNKLLDNNPNADFGSSAIGKMLSGLNDVITPGFYDPRAGNDNKGYKGGFWNSLTNLSNRMGAGQPSHPGYNVHIKEMKIDNTSGTPEELRKNIKLGFQDMFDSVIRKSAANMDRMPVYPVAR